MKPIKEFLDSIELKYSGYREKITSNSVQPNNESYIKLNKLRSILERINLDMDIDLVDTSSQSIIKKTKISEILKLLESGRYFNNTTDISINKQLGKVVLSVKE